MRAETSQKRKTKEGKYEKKIIRDVRSAGLFLAFKKKGEWSFILTLLLLCLVFLTHAGAKEPLVMPEGPAVSVDAVKVETFEPVFQPSEDGPAPSPNHPPFDQIPPMPMPEPLEIDKEIDPSVPKGLCYPDPVTGETVFMEVPASSRLTDEIVRVPGYDGADGGSGVMEEPPTFVDMTKVSHTEDDPYRRNVKLVMRFVNALGQNEFAACSGTMIDAETVQTAGHCLFDHYYGLGWAQDVWVYPGWDGNGGQSNPPPSIINPYGYGHATTDNLKCIIGWVSNEKYDDDLGLVGIDRAVGMLTGWFGRYRGGDCDEIKPIPHYNCSYPVECCNTGCTLHTGRDMYCWSGHFDSCPNNQLQIDTTGGCFNAGWGGMSGSGAYYFFEGKRYVRAVLSHGNINRTYSRYCRLWNWFINDTNNIFIPHVRGSSFDLQALDMNAKPSTIQAGSKTTLLNHLATNPTNGSSSWSTRTYRVYLSSNDNISTSDTLLSKQYYSYSFAPMQNTRVNMVQVTIPTNTPPGDYFIGVIYDSSTDSNSGNNDTTGWDAAPIHVTAASPPADEIIGIWDSGIWYYDVSESKFTKMTYWTTTGDIAAGDITGDGKADVASCWDSGLWYQNGSTLGWTQVYHKAPNRIACGDITGDGRDEIIGTGGSWSDGIWYRNLKTGTWHKTYGYTPNGPIAAGDVTGDGRADIVSCWPLWGLWYQNGSTLAMIPVYHKAPNRIACGDITGDGRDEIIGCGGTWSDGVWYLNLKTGTWHKPYGYTPAGEIAAGDVTGDRYADMISIWLNGLWYQNGQTWGWTKVFYKAPNQVTAGNISGN